MPMTFYLRQILIFTRHPAVLAVPSMLNCLLAPAILGLVHCATPQMDASKSRTKYINYKNPACSVTLMAPCTSPAAAQANMLTPEQEPLRLHTALNTIMCAMLGVILSTPQQKV
jgi:hypothetical protein